MPRKRKTHASPASPADRYPLDTQIQGVHDPDAFGWVKEWDAASGRYLILWWWNEYTYCMPDEINPVE